MAKDMLQAVLAAEQECAAKEAEAKKQAEARQQQAKQEAAALVEKAQADAGKLLRDNERTLAQQSETALEQARVEARQECSEISRNAE